MPTETRTTADTRRRTGADRESGWLNRRETAYFADISIRQVDKAIEEKVVTPGRSNGAGVQIDRDDVVVIALITRAGVKLPRQTKAQIRKWIRGATTETECSELALSDVLVLRLGPGIASMAGRLDRYLDHRERYLDSNPEIQGGEPVIVGTRLPVSSVAMRLESGDSVDDLVADHPEIPKVAFEAARIYAETHPRRGRPVRPWRDG